MEETVVVSYRYSHSGDEPFADNIIKHCFGGREDCLDNLDNRYLFACVNGTPVAMSGLMWSDTYGGLEIDWSGTLKEYRKLGIMHELFRRLLATTQDDVYCSCWRIGDNERVNLQSVVDDLGFKVLRPRHLIYDVSRGCEYTDKCIMYRGEFCSCCEDLYLRKGSSNICK